MCGFRIVLGSFQIIFSHHVIRILRKWQEFEEFEEFGV